MTDLLIMLSFGFDAKEFFGWFVENANYLYVFAFMAIESSFLPFPSEVVVPPAAWVAATSGNMNIFLIVLVATAGALVGALVNYYLSMWLGRPIIYRFVESRLGHVLLLSREKVEKAEKYFDEHGATATLIGRLIPVIRQYISVPAGLAKMNVVKFVIYTAIGACIWNAILVALGYWLSTFVSRAQLFEFVEKYNGYLTLAGIALLGLVVLFFIYKALSHKKS